MDFYFHRRVTFILKIKTVSNTSSYLEAVGECSTVRSPECLQRGQCSQAAGQGPNSPERGGQSRVHWERPASTELTQGQGSTQGAQAGAAADRARDRAGHKATAQVQGLSKRQSQGWAGGKAHGLAEAGTEGSGQRRNSAPGQGVQPWGGSSGDTSCA